MARRKKNVQFPVFAVLLDCYSDVGFFRRRFGTDRRRSVCFIWAARTARLRSANLPRRWVHLDPGLLGVGWRRLLLGARNMGGIPGSRISMDAWLLGMGRRRFPVP